MLHQTGLVQRRLEIELLLEQMRARDPGEQGIDVVHPHALEHRANLLVGMRQVSHDE